MSAPEKTHSIEYLLQPLSAEEKADVFVAMQSKSFARDVWERFCHNKRALTGLILMSIIVLFSVFGTVFSPYAYDEANVAAHQQLPNAAHWFGTDYLGRDLFTRTMYGIRISLMVGLVSTVINTIIGTVLGGFAGYMGNMADMLIMRVCDVLYAVPSLLYVILIMLINGANVTSILIGICISGWVGISRIVRSQVITLKEREYALASYVLGSTRRRIFFKHLLSNSMGPILVTLTLMIPQAIFMEAFLSFIGVGIAAPQASLGTLAQSAQTYLELYPTQMLFPVSVICLIIFSLTFVSKGLEEALDPKNRR